jgi:hypothetical protein
MWSKATAKDLQQKDKADNETGAAHKNTPYLQMRSKATAKGLKE